MIQYLFVTYMSLSEMKLQLKKSCEVWTSETKKYIKKKGDDCLMGMITVNPQLFKSLPDCQQYKESHIMEGRETTCVPVKINEEFEHMEGRETTCVPVKIKGEFEHDATNN